jgi:hypothetical protein
LPQRVSDEERKLYNIDTWTLVMILGSHSLLSAHSRESLVVVGNTLSYGASEVIVNEESGGVRRSRFLTTKLLKLLFFFATYEWTQ